MKRDNLIKDWNKKCRGFTTCDINPIEYVNIKLNKKAHPDDPMFAKCHNKAIKLSQ